MIPLVDTHDTECGTGAITCCWGTEVFVLVGGAQELLRAVGICSCAVATGVWG